MASLDVPLTFSFSVDDPLAPEHDLISRWVREAVASLPAGRYYEDVDLKNLPSGRDLLASTPESYSGCRLARGSGW